MVCSCDLHVLICHAQERGSRGKRVASDIRSGRTGPLSNKYKKYAGQLGGLEMARSVSWIVNLFSVKIGRRCLVWNWYRGVRVGAGVESALL